MGLLYNHSLCSKVVSLKHSLRDSQQWHCVLGFKLLLGSGTHPGHCRVLTLLVSSCSILVEPLLRYDFQNILPETSRCFQKLWICPLLRFFCIFPSLSPSLKFFIRFFPLPIHLPNQMQFLIPWAHQNSRKSLFCCVYSNLHHHFCLQNHHYVIFFPFFTKSSAITESKMQGWGNGLVSKALAVQPQGPEFHP